MNVATLDLCRELFELSRWEDTYARYYLLDGCRSVRPTIHLGDEWPGHQLIQEAPAYDHGYLMRKLPDTIDDFYQLYIQKGSAFYGDLSEMTGHDTKFLVDAETPEDVLTKLAIELLKAGYLQREDAR